MSLPEGLCIAVYLARTGYTATQKLRFCRRMYRCVSHAGIDTCRFTGGCLQHKRDTSRAFNRFDRGTATRLGTL